MKRLVLIGFVWFGCAAAWVVLGSTLVHRSGESSYEMLQGVHQLWGAPIAQAPPSASAVSKVVETEWVVNYDPQGRPVQTQQQREREVLSAVPLVASEIAADLDLEHRKKGLLWFSTYAVGFSGRYVFENDSDTAREVRFKFPRPTSTAALDGFEVHDAAGARVAITVAHDAAVWKQSLAPKEKVSFEIRYRTRGTGAWSYLVSATGEARDFQLALSTDFADVDFPAGSLSPTSHEAEGGTWTGTWNFSSLIASSPIGISLPQRVNPGPLAARITFFAPVGLLFFFFVLAVLSELRGLGIHPASYFLFGCSFFAFHLLFSYLVDHLSILPAFAASSVVSVLLVVSYARLFVGWKFALRELGISQLLYLVLFSMTFLWDGFTGLSITVGAIATLFVMMQVTGRRLNQGERRPLEASVAAAPPVA